MMVTFISQCEKKALNRTRRVLDAFADRIGDNTWQTVITQEGLFAVKKLLRKTASKNTAVSCHWIRSRSRSELIWVVGRKSAFNHLGHVPVNYTSKEVIMDNIPIETSQYLANSSSQSLSKHLFAVGYIAYKLLESAGIQRTKLKQSVFISGVLHDIGKIDPEFQKWVRKKAKKPDSYTPEDGVHIDTPKKFSFENHPRHHEISWVLAEAMLKGSSLNSNQCKQIAHGIFWHHTKPYRTKDLFTDPSSIYKVFEKSLPNKDINEIFDIAKAVFKDVKLIAKKFEIENQLPKISDSFNFEKETLPEFKKYDVHADEISEFKENVKLNSLNNLVRAALISADRKVSGVSANDLDEYLSEGTLVELLDLETEQSQFSLKTGIRNCLDNFNSKYPNSERNIEQHKTAKSLASIKDYSVYNQSYNIGTLQGPAGCGKTKVALEWAIETDAAKIIWICPRVQVCQGLLHDLTSNDYLPDNNIEIFTGEDKRIINQTTLNDEEISETDESDYFSGEIVITTIDQVINSIITHTHVTTMVEVLKAHVVFDEFHELVNIPAFNLLFAELIEAKKLQDDKANTLLVSATPHLFYLNEFLEISPNNFKHFKSFNQSKYKIDFRFYDDEIEETPLITEAHQGKTFVISNTASDAQIGFLRHHSKEKSVLLHSKYLKQDKAYWFDQVYESFKHDGTCRYDVLRSGPIVQAALNISCDRMITELTCAENWLQRLGRLDRFGENNEINVYTTTIPRSFKNEVNQKSNFAKFLNQLNILHSTHAWLSFLKDRLDSNVVTIDQLYRLYTEFYSDKGIKNRIELDIISALKKSVKIIKDKITDPISFPPKSKQTRGAIKISSNSLRGDNRFVQMAVCKVSDSLQLSFEEHYAYTEEFDQSQPQLTVLTESIDTMQGFGDEDNNLVQFMRKKHHNIKGGVKARNEWELIKKARSLEFPIYLSYTPADLERVNSKPHLQAFYYVICDRQPVGAMRITKLEKQLQIENKITE